MTEDLLRAAVRAAPHDQDPRLKLADFLAEAGRDAEAADQRRWAVATKTDFYFYWHSGPKAFYMTNQMPVPDDGGDDVNAAGGAMDVEVGAGFMQALGLPLPTEREIVKVTFVIDVVQTGKLELRADFIPFIPPTSRGR